jgi:rod shape-determining protein MreD
MPVVLRQVLFGVGVVLLQWLVFGRLTIYGAYPDIVLLFVAFVGLRFGRVPGAVAGFGTGLLLGALYGMWGSHMLVKTVMGFVVGHFAAETSEMPNLGPIQAFGGALAVALVHNGLLAIILALDHGTRTAGYLIGSFWVGSAVLTAFVAMLWTLVKSRW